MCASIRPIKGSRVRKARNKTKIKTKGNFDQLARRVQLPISYIWRALSDSRAIIAKLANILPGSLAATESDATSLDSLLITDSKLPSHRPGQQAANGRSMPASFADEMRFRLQTSEPIWTSKWLH